MIDRLIARLALAALLTVSLPATIAVAQAQSGTGLKLGPAEDPAEKLDLGASPAPGGLEKLEPPPERPASVTPAEPAGEAPLPANQRTTIGAWEVACGSANTNCAMAQIGNDAAGTPVLEMVVRKLKEPLEVGERTAIAVLDVITPLGVVLTEGLALTIDNGKREAAPFQICTEQGCLVREPIDQDLINRLKRGNSAVLSVIAANQGEVTSSLSLNGFTKAYDSLK